MKKTRPHGLLYGSYLREESPSERTKAEAENARQALETFVQQDVPEMMEKLRADFRTLLGVIRE